MRRALWASGLIFLLLLLFLVTEAQAEPVLHLTWTFAVPPNTIDYQILDAGDGNATILVLTAPVDPPGMVCRYDSYRNTTTNLTEFERVWCTNLSLPPIKMFLGERGPVVFVQNGSGSRLKQFAVVSISMVRGHIRWSKEISKEETDDDFMTSISTFDVWSGKILLTYMREVGLTYYQVYLLLDERTGRVLWNATFSSYGYVPTYARIVGDKVYAAESSIVAGEIKDKVKVLSLGSGALLWERSDFVERGGGTIASDRERYTVVCTTDPCWLFSVDADGPLFSFPAPNQLKFVGPRLIALYSENLLTSIDLEGGSQDWWSYVEPANASKYLFAWGDYAAVLVDDLGGIIRFYYPENGSQAGWVYLGHFGPPTVDGQVLVVEEGYFLYGYTMYSAPSYPGWIGYLFSVLRALLLNPILFPFWAALSVLALWLRVRLWGEGS